MKVMILGASGMLGQALMAEGVVRGHQMIGERVEVRDTEALMLHLAKHNPDVIINTVALVDLKECEENPGLAYEVNTRPVSVITDWLQYTICGFVQISTDHYFVINNGNSERHPVFLRNEYARTKHIAEQIALSDPNSLVIRTNIVGLRGHGKPTFAEWAMDAIEADAPMTLFEDYYTSSIDVWSFSSILFDLLDQRPSICGLLNVASNTVSNKKQFIEALAARMGRPLNNAMAGSVKALQPGRATNCGLDVSRVESLLSRQMPDLDHVVNALVERRK